MIKERYVNFEVASLLRDKGFDECVHAWHNIFDKHNLDFRIAIDAPHLQIPAPTQSMACDWIEETFNISIEVWVGIIGYRIEILNALKDPNIAASSIIHDFNDDALCGDNSDGSWSSKELAYNEALKYVLTNLI